MAALWALRGDGAEDLAAACTRPGDGPGHLAGQKPASTTALGICAGTAEVADSGLLNGHTATTNTSWFSEQEKSAPTVHCIRDVRYVGDWPVVTSTNLAAGMDVTLHVIDHSGGRAVALTVARQIAYAATSPRTIVEVLWTQRGPGVDGWTAGASAEWVPARNAPTERRSKP
jgi:putative intracellular protease/amidase